MMAPVIKEGCFYEYLVGEVLCGNKTPEEATSGCSPEMVLCAETKRKRDLTLLAFYDVLNVPTPLTIAAMGRGLRQMCREQMYYGP